MAGNPDNLEDVGRAGDAGLDGDIDTFDALDDDDVVLREGERRPAGGSKSWLGIAALLFGAIVLVAAVFYGSGARSQDEQDGGSAETTGPIGMSMAGPAVEVNVTDEAFETEPEAPDLSTPEAALRSYLDWSSYAYRTAQSSVAIPTMSTYQEVRVDSYVQYNIQQGRLIDQTLTDLVIHEVEEEGASATITVRETWEYRYISISEAGKVIGGPYEVEYDAEYTMVKNDAGDWVVDAVDAQPLSEVQ